MAVLKWKKDATTWVSLYYNAFKNRLRRDKNLSDLTNRPDARKNLELVGEVTDHWHDERYKPMLTQLRGDLDKAVTSLNATINTKINGLEAQHNADIKNLQSQINSLKARVDALETRCANIEKSITNLTNKINSVFDANGRLTFPNQNKFWIS